MEKPILYVVLNKELNMSAGKAAAQTAHAVAMLSSDLVNFAMVTRRTVIVLEADNAEQIKNLSEYLDQVGLDNVYYIDEGVNGVAPYSVTALAIAPFDESDEELRVILEPFNLYSGPSVNPKEEARKLLNEIRWEAMDGFIENTPWYLRRTIKWLKKNK